MSGVLRMKGGLLRAVHLLMAVCGSAAIAAPSYIATPLGGLGGSTSRGLAINASGQVVGFAYTAGDNTFPAFLHNGTAMRDLGTLGGVRSNANSINSNGEVTGESGTPMLDAPFLYSNNALYNPRAIHKTLNPSTRSLPRPAPPSAAA